MRVIAAGLMMVFTAIALADARIELDTTVCHAPWSQENADFEYKGYCQGLGLQLKSGNYNAYASGRFEGLDDNMVEAPVFLEGSDTEAAQVTEVNCLQTAGVFQDDDGNEYQTNDCTVLIRYKRTGKGISIRYVVELRDAALAAARTRGADPVQAGISSSAR